MVNNIWKMWDEFIKCTWQYESVFEESLLGTSHTQSWMLKGLRDYWHYGASPSYKFEGLYWYYKDVWFWRSKSADNPMKAQSAFEMELLWCVKGWKDFVLDNSILRKKELEIWSLQCVGRREYAHSERQQHDYLCFLEVQYIGKGDNYWCTSKVLGPFWELPAGSGKISRRESTGEGREGLGEWEEAAQPPMLSLLPPLLPPSLHPAVQFQPIPEDLAKEALGVLTIHWLCLTLFHRMASIDQKFCQWKCHRNLIISSYVFQLQTLGSC